MHLWVEFANKDGTEDAIQILKKQEETLARECAKRFKEVYDATTRLEVNWERKVRYEADFIVSLSKGREQIRKTCNELKGKEAPLLVKKDILRLQISSLTLKEFQRFLISDPNGNERLSLVTGSETGEGVRVLSRMEHLKLEHQSPGCVKANDVDAHLKIISLTEKHGHQVFAMFHSHMSNGANSTMPSGIDLAYQNRLVKIGCDAIGGIFSLDKFFRAFSTWKEFELDVYGNGVKKLLDNPREKVFQIIELN